ncbi:MAG: hypothetical protein KAF27_10970 [Porphyrobacter sp.]|nr:hypothetical protein [Porphyrobacter sp.]
MRLAAPILLLTGLSACSPPVIFSVSVDEDIRSGTLTLNGASAPLMRNVDGAHWAKWDGSDASGTIRIVFPDGATAVCEVGYVTHGMMDVQTYVVADRVCSQVRGE